MYLVSFSVPHISKSLDLCFVGNRAIYYLHFNFALSWWSKSWTKWW